MAQDLLQGILHTLQSKLENAAKQSVYDQFAEETLAFFQSIDWSQPWLLFLLGFHCLCMLVPILIRKKHTALSVYFFILLGMAALTQPLNALGAEHWRSFASTNYFDPSGLFIVTIYAFPLLINGFLTLMLILSEAIHTMVLVKRQMMRTVATKKSQ
ncbi:transmembrane protein 18-domain-containing protein, partial [Spinellus fusiger]